MKIPRGATLCTFHSLCARLLREFAGRAGLPAGFSIYDQSDQKAVSTRSSRAEELDPKEYPPARVLRQIGVLKNHMLGPDKARPEDFAPELPAAPPRRGLRGLREEARRRGRPGLRRPPRPDGPPASENDAELRETLARRYRYILVDEYQDTNTCQYRIARALAPGHDNLFVTGDPDQSIYGWRGADIGNILAFEKDFPGAPVVRLEENFRSTPQVLSLADDLIRPNVRRKEKRLIARKPGREPAASLPLRRRARGSPGRGRLGPMDARRARGSTTAGSRSSTGSTP